MSYSNLMVYLEAGRSNTRLLKIARDIAQRFQADVTGVTACQPIQLYYGDGYASGDLLEQDRRKPDV